MSRCSLAGLMVATSIGCTQQPVASTDAKTETDANAADAEQIPPKFIVGPIPQSILDVKTDGDFIYDTVKTIAPELDGYDDVLLEEDLGLAYVTGRDGWIWKVDLKTEKAEHFVDVPVMAAGIHPIPGQRGKVALSCSRSDRGNYPDGGDYPKSEKVGLYTLDLATKEVTPLVPRLTNVPNPFSGSTDIMFELSAKTRVNIAVYDIQGKLLDTVLEAVLPQGPHSVAWNGRSETGEELPSGIYFFRFKAGSFEANKKAILIR